MSGHVIVWTFDGDCVTASVVCLEEPGEDCRLTGHCDCEEWGQIERREDGTIWHALTEGYRDRDVTRDVTQWHEVKPQDECNVAAYMNEDPSLIPELADGVKPFEIGRTPIEPVWVGDYYEWKRAEPC